MEASFYVATESNDIFIFRLITLELVVRRNSLCHVTLRNRLMKYLPVSHMPYNNLSSLGLTAQYRQVARMES